MKVVLKVTIAIEMLALIGGAVLAQSGNDLFQQALVKERTEGNIAEAIKLYQTIVQKYRSDRKLAAKALFQIGQAYEKLGNAEARKAYERIAREYADQVEIAVEGRKRLAALGGAVSSDALTARQVLTGSDVDPMGSITPDGRLMTMTDWSSGDVAIRNMSTGQVKRLMAKAGSWQDNAEYGLSPILSSDLRQVAYWWFTKDLGELRVIPNEPGGKPRVLVRNSEFEFAPADWSRDGKSVLGTMWKQDRTAQLAWVSAVDGSIKVLKSLEWRHPEDPILSPDGRYIAYSALERSDSADSHIYILAADGASETELVRNAGINEAPVWTPDGTHILFVSNRSGSFGL